MEPGSVLSHAEMCVEEGISLQRGMNFRIRGGRSVILMSRRPSAPYSDRVEDDGRTLIYEGHDVPRGSTAPYPKLLNQEATLPSGRLTQNGLFFEAAMAFQRGDPPELVRVYEKLRDGTWVYNGVFRLVDSWIEPAGGRSVFKFRLEATDETNPVRIDGELEPTRMIPSDVKREVWARDRGRCVTCGAEDNLHFDHVIPYSKGGSSLVAENIQILCARHNLQKRDRIE
jgi:hypothetical protein